MASVKYVLALTPNQKRALAVRAEACCLAQADAQGFMLRWPADDNLLTPLRGGGGGGAVVQVAVVLGGAQTAHQLRNLIKAAQRKQKQLVKEIQSQQTAQTKQRPSTKVAVNRVFFERLCTILRMYVCCVG